ncbi:penicillin-binding protein activator LpoB [Sphingomonas cavernae]|uniref:Penicillin-binding protein activator LpoB n=2 Tax=Sphingomonas cavernae TaxID=2320861 RepID=A0A418WJI8_9SPHN|nr:CsgG/HfaB family protein [Sphingomonas cavernae]RJF90211.1 penicillin-binding protein activator LpoB [Sphingomonas cavernae]
MVARNRFRSGVIFIATTVFALGLPANPAVAQSKARKAQVKKTAEIPVCARKLGTIAIVEPDAPQWGQYGLSSPEAIIKLFAAKSGCFGIVDRNKGLSIAQAERDLARDGELQRGSNLGKAQIKAADYFIVPDIVTQNGNSGGGGLGGGLGSLGGLLGGKAGMIGGLLGSVNIKKKEANVTLALVNARTTEQERVVEGFAKKTDIGFGGGTGYFDGFGGGFGGSSYANTELGQVVTLAYLDAFTNLVRQLGGLPENAAAAAPVAKD